jgi:putative ABC transport system substrate-binding protein
MMKAVVVRRGLFRVAIAALAAYSSIATALADDRPFGDWFHYSSDLDATWNFVGNSADPMRVEIRRKAAEQTGPRRRILVLYPRPSSAYDIAISQMLRVFYSREYDVEFVAINFELKDPQGKSALQFAQKNKFDLVVAMGSESTAWLYDNYRNGAIPVVTVCSKDPVQLGQMKDYEQGSKNNFAFTSLNVPVEVQMAYVKELRPELKNLAVLVDSKNVSAVQTQAEPIAAFARTHGIQVLSVAVVNPAAAREELARIVPDAIRTMRQTDPDLTKSVFWLTGSTSVFREIKTLNQHAGKVPIVSVVPEIVTTGPDTAVLGIGISFESNAHLAAIYADQVLRGVAKVGDLKVGIVSPPDIAISFLKAREIGTRVPFSFFESASFVYDYDGRPVRSIEHGVTMN